MTDSEWNDWLVWWTHCVCGSGVYSLICFCCDITSSNILTPIFTLSVFSVWLTNINFNTGFKTFTRMTIFPFFFFFCWNLKMTSKESLVHRTFTLMIIINIVLCASCGVTLAMPQQANWQALWKQQSVDSEKTFGTHQRPVWSQWVLMVSFTELPVDNTVS